MKVFAVWGNTSEWDGCDVVIGVFSNADHADALASRTGCRVEEYDVRDSPVDGLPWQVFTFGGDLRAIRRNFDPDCSGRWENGQCHVWASSESEAIKKALDVRKKGQQ